MYNSEDFDVEPPPLGLNTSDEESGHTENNSCSQTNHTKKKPHSCTYCSRRFTKVGNLQTHIHIHTGEKPHSCTYCGKGFTQLGHLRSHIYIHTGEKPHVCTYCGKRFRHPPSLKYHISTHTREKSHHSLQQKDHSPQAAASMRLGNRPRLQIKLHNVPKFSTVDRIRTPGSAETQAILRDRTKHLSDTAWWQRSKLETSCSVYRTTDYEDRFVGEAERLWEASTAFNSVSKCLCAPGDNCLSCSNRCLYIECDDESCGAGGRSCLNRNFTMLDKRCADGNFGVKVRPAGGKGHGLFSCRRFKPGKLVVEYTGDIITRKERDRRTKHVYKGADSCYSLNYDHNLLIDAVDGGVGRFLSHSCTPNCEIWRWVVDEKPRIGIFAGKLGVAAGVELTIDYNLEVDVQECLCGSDQCRGTIGRRAEGSKKAIRMTRDSRTSCPKIRFTTRDSRTTRPKIRLIVNS